MKQPILFIALLLVVTATGVAQQKETPVCTVRILLLNQNWEDRSQIREMMSPDQTKWWLEDGQKKFKNFCFVSASKPHDYRIVWTDKESYRAGYIPTTTTTTGEVKSGNRTGTYSETSTTNAGREVTFVTTYVQIRLFKADSEPESEPLFNELHKGKWIWSKADRAALENALKALDKLTKP
jgi:hypothetical protein